MQVVRVVAASDAFDGLIIKQEALPVLVWVISTVLMGWKPCKKGVCV
jgi:hypothetical protein